MTSRVADTKLLAIIFSKNLCSVIRNIFSWGIQSPFLSIISSGKMVNLITNEVIVYNYVYFSHTRSVETAVVMIR